LTTPRRPFFPRKPPRRPPSQTAKFRQTAESPDFPPSNRAKSAKKEKKSAKILEIAPRFRYTVVCRFGGDVFRVRFAEIPRMPRRVRRAVGGSRFADFVININTRFFSPSRAPFSPKIPPSLATSSPPRRRFPLPKSTNVP